MEIKYMDRIIDSLDLFHYPSKQEIKIINSNFKPGKDEYGNFIRYLNIHGINYKYIPAFNLLTITLNTEALFNQNIPEIEGLYKIFVDALQKEIELLFQIMDAKKLKISRLDYYKDIYTEYADMYMSLLKKVYEKYRYFKAYKGYETTMYLNSKSKTGRIYDKEEEQRTKMQTVDDKYSNIFRIELQLERPFFRYQLKQYGIEDTLYNYFTVEERERAFNETFRNIFFKGDYYNLYHSEKILKQYYTGSMTGKLIEFQKLISCKGASEARRAYKDNFAEYRKRLEYAGINPVPIPKNNLYGLKYLPNLFNFTCENI